MGLKFVWEKDLLVLTYTWFIQNFIENYINSLYSLGTPKGSNLQKQSLSTYWQLHCIIIYSYNYIIIYSYNYIIIYSYNNIIIYCYNYIIIYI